ncbi:NRDE family protein [Thioalkalivibrio sp. XN8]|uniref:NRDE family protein n=1 Tax=Thioalkalivibrio sp. XN8 TaxID=2712863 RepID=UPI0013EA10DB|nr:NRDE family protein [Thioalkalivibrio sp. XN8]NGP52556.1 NRDE family protein [Thioalkalivibrio sp. XN8]
MCLLVFAWQTAAARPLVLAGNRDEFHDRPAAPADWWPGPIVGGRDLRAGGTWLAAARDGRFAVVTNYREPMAEGRGPRSRGELVSAYLAGDTGPQEWARRVAARGDDYAGFNLLLGAPDRLVYLSNRGRGPEVLEPGIYGLSNHLLDTPWPKLERTRARFAELLGAGADTGALLGMLADRTPAAADELPDTGLPPEWERLLSSPFIVDPRYGTRCSTVLRLAKGVGMELAERSFDPAGAAVDERRFEFALES